MNFRSHTKEEMIKAVKEGKKLFRLDTVNAGCDDILIAEIGESREDVLSDILLYHELSELPDGWTLEETDYDLEDAL